ncbi:hypothetical protein AXX12_13940 [Anaerosporomusa subterranea]|uniref:SnoaL-like domain-containing protein n=1 Tax=Anaerosporomusa subterranea TaxID=1794912 RepID=A0A154BMV2_ANASB|nr:nuclear transport factor 2 family protein [Anaerosporomusa subterranea]KYZ75256.1 hypothetical protein AXX12_13940 [Anaerosporomusa subterranea]
MNTKLSQAIETYFHAANAHDSKSLADCFAEDAVVHDEGKDYHGLSAIKEWNETAGKKYDLTLDVISAVEENGETVVTAQASGNFEGSPISINFYFTVENQKITSLRCE